MLKKSWHLILCAGLSLSAASCATDDTPAAQSAEPSEEVAERSQLIVRAAERTGDEVVAEISFVRGVHSPGPRVLELRLRLGDALELVEATAGSSLTRADKDLVTQQPEAGLLRLVAYSSANVSSIDSGVIARLRLKRALAGSTRLEFLTDSPLFAPAEAQEGLLVGEALDL